MGRSLGQFQPYWAQLGPFEPILKPNLLPSCHLPALKARTRPQNRHFASSLKAPSFKLFNYQILKNNADPNNQDTKAPMHQCTYSRGWSGGMRGAIKSRRRSETTRERKAVFAALAFADRSLLSSKLGRSPIGGRGTSGRKSATSTHSGRKTPKTPSATGGRSQS